MFVNDKIVITKSDSDANKENDVYGQGAAIYNLGLIGTINADFTNNGVENTSNIAGKATANGGAIAAYSGSQIDEINGDFIGNYVCGIYPSGYTISEQREVYCEWAAFKWSYCC